MKKFQPLLNRILIKPDPIEEVTEAGIHMPDTVQKVSNRGEVIAVGSGHRTDDGTLLPPEVSPGDRVMFEARRETQVTIDGEAHLVLSETKILGIIDPDE